MDETPHQQARIVAALGRPDAYPRPPASVEHLETHISHVFLAGDRVYKLKKPVRLDFIDFSTRELRRRYCLRELELNRRLAPETYRRVVPIVEDAGRFRVADRAIEQGSAPAPDASAPVEYAVEMRRLPETGMMPRLLDRGALTAADLGGLAELLADFHARAERSARIEEIAGPARMRARIEANLDDLESFASAIPERASPEAPILGPALHEHLRRWFDAELRARETLMRERIEDDRARDCHGDLHAGNICLSQRGWVVFDCIEFDDDLRCLDVAAEMGFLAMDLARRGHPELADALLDRYAARAHDQTLFDLQPLYQTHYGLVRGKVDAIAARQHADDHDEGVRRWRTAAEFAAFVSGRTLGPVLIVLCGLPATGKSHIARALAHPLDAEILQSDRIRKRLAGIDPTARAHRSAHPDIYTPGFTDRTYDALADRARELLGAGRSVIADATHPTAARRAQTLATARSLDVPAAIIHATCAEPEIQRRMRDRAADASEVSDADLDVYRRAKAGFEPPGAGERAPIIASDEHADSMTTILRALDALASPDRAGAAHPSHRTTRAGAGRARHGKDR